MAISDDILNYLKEYGGDAIKTALGGLPGGQAAADVVSNAGPLMDKAAENPMVQAMANGVTGQALAPNIPNPGNPLSGLGEGAVVGALSQNQDAAKPSSGVSGSWDAPVPSAAETPLESNPSAKTAPLEPVKPDLVAPTAPITMDHTEDQRRREANDAAIEHKRRMGLIPAAIAGAGDAIASGAKAFGVNNSTDVQSKVLESGEKSREADKTKVELDIKRDPNSDVSKAYRQMVSQIVPDLAKKPEFNNMSAQDIGDKLPMIDTMMRAQAQKDSKEMGMAQLKANKDISLGLKEDQQQDKLENQYKQQLISVRGDANISSLEKQRDAAAQAYNLVRDSQGPAGKGYNLSEPQLVELYGQLYLAMTGRGLTGEALHAMNQATAKQKSAALATFIGMSPNATTDAIGDRLKHMTTTLGTQVQSNLDKRMEARTLPPSGLHPDRVEPIKKAGRGFTFGELVEQSNKRASGTSEKPKLSKDSLGLF